MNTGWLSIETAPEWETVMIAYYQPGSQVPLWIAAEKRRGATWGRPGHVYTPTHWQPLPDPPARSEAA